MAYYADLINYLSPILWWRMGDAASPLTEEIDAHNATAANNPDFLATGALSGDTDGAVGFNLPYDGTWESATCAADYSMLDGATEFTICLWAKIDSAASGKPFFSVYGGASSHFMILGLEDSVWTSSTNSKKPVAAVEIGGVENFVIGGTELTADTWYFVAMRFNAGKLDLIIDDSQVATNTTAATALDTSRPWDIAIARLWSGTFLQGTLDEISVFDTALTDGVLGQIYTAGTTGTGPDIPTPPVPPDVVPMTLTGAVSIGASSLPMRLITETTSAAGSMGMLLEAPDSTHYFAASARWAATVVLNGADISDQIVNEITIETEEDSSGLCDFDLIPDAGSVDPSDYENKPVQITFVGLDAGESVVYTSRRFTGTTATASYNPDSGIMSVGATSDLQGRLENLDRATIDAIIGGQWSEHVFNDSADGWQYAQDQLSTLASECHINNYGQIVIVPYAAKATADVELSDSKRFNDTLSLARASRRDLISRVRVNMDFRFVRLRHREVGVNFANSLGFCSYLNNGWKLPNKSMVIAAADSNDWVRTSDITFTELPPAGTYCTPSRGWTGGAADFCLAASWTAARRWAQTVTEEYSLNVIATDLEEAIGRQEVNADYGIEATYDGADFENVRGYNDRPTGSTLSIYTDDWQKDATDSEADGRTAMEAAQECALAVAKVLILRRARKNRVSVESVYDPSITLESTVRINTPSLVAKGKVAQMRETLDISNGNVQMALDVALSRHGGTGLASDDPLDPAAEPAQPQEETSSRTYTLAYRLGGLAASPADDDTWDGYMTNVSPAVQDTGAELYRERFVVKMPAIEDAARDATSVIQSADYEVAVPQDELTLSS